MNAAYRNRSPRRAGALAGLLVCALAALARVVAAAEPDSLEDCERRLLERGQVRYRHYDTAGKTSLGGLTTFHFDHSYSYTYRYDFREIAGERRVVVHPTVTATVRLRHEIELPRGFADSTAWFRRLRRHELDHVSVSSDERAELLFRWLITHLGAVVRPDTGRSGVVASIDQALREEVDRRHAEVMRVIHAGYRRLDSLTAHGSLPLADRGAFFDALYTRDGLEAAGFPWVREVEPLLEMPRYRNALRIRCD